MKSKSNSGQYLGSFSGKVYAHLGRGKQIGYPTANVQLDKKIPHGVYISQAFVNGAWHPSLTFVGIPRTFIEDSAERAETYILEGEFELVGQELKVELLVSLRENKKFAGVPELIQAIEQDVSQAKSFFAAKRGER